MDIYISLLISFLIFCKNIFQTKLHKHKNLSVKEMLHNSILVPTKVKQNTFELGNN